MILVQSCVLCVSTQASDAYISWCCYVSGADRQTMLPIEFGFKTQTGDFRRNRVTRGSTAKEIPSLDNRALSSTLSRKSVLRLQSTSEQKKTSKVS